MPIDLTKGQKINLSKINLDKKQTLENIHVGLGWDVNSTKGAPFDLDAMVYSLNSSGKWDENYACNYSHLDTPNGAIHHCGDNLTGEGEGDDEVIWVKLSKLPAHIVKLRFMVVIYDAVKRRQTFGQVRNAFIRVVDQNGNTELCRYTLSNEFSQFYNITFAELDRNGNEWEFTAVGKGNK